MYRIKNRYYHLITCKVKVSLVLLNVGGDCVAVGR